MSRATYLAISGIVIACVVACPSFTFAQQADEESLAAKPAMVAAGTITTIAGKGPTKMGYSGDGGQAAAAQVGLPNGIFLDGAGNIYFTDHYTDALREINVSTGIISRVAGRGTCESALFDCGDGGPALDSQLRIPYGGTVDAEGNMYFADEDNQEVRRIDHATKVISQVAGSSCPGQSEFGCGGTEGFKGDGGPASQSLLEFPTAVAFDSEGNLYIADSYNNAIRKVAKGTDIITTVVGRGKGCARQTDSFGDGCTATQAILNDPIGIAFDKAGNLFIAQFDLVRRVDAKTHIVTTYAGSIPFSNTCPGALDTLGEGCPATSITMQLSALAVDPGGNVNVMDILGERGGIVWKIDFKTGLLHRVAGGGNCSPNNPNNYYCGDGKLALNAEINQPTGIAFDKTGDLYIADFHNSAVRKVALSSKTYTPPPVFSPAPGTYHASEPVRITDSNAQAKIHYTIDGSTPTKNSPEYGGPIAVTETTVVSAIALAPNLQPSEVVTAPYTIDRPPSVSTKAATSVGTYNATFNATVNDEDQAGEYWFVYGLSTNSLVSQTSKRSIRVSTATQSVNVIQYGLSSKKTYFFRIVSSNSTGTTSGNVLSFTTQ